MSELRGSSLEVAGSSLSAGTWQVNVRGPVEVTRTISSVLSSIAITEPNLPQLDIVITNYTLARGRVGKEDVWTFALPKRGWLSLILGYAVATALSLMRELHFVHAGVVEINGRGYVLVGPSGAGKTSAVGVLLRRGAAYLSDEVALFDSRTAAVYPFSLPLAVKPWTARAMGPLPPTRLVASEAGVQYFLPERRAQAPVPLDSIVLLDPTQHGTEPEEFSRAEMLLALSEQPSSFRYRHRLEAAFSAFAQLIRHARCFRLGSADPAGAAGKLPI